MIRIESKDRVNRRILADPCEGLKPVILGNPSRQFDVWGGREQLALRVEHPERKREKKNDPTPDFIAQHPLAQHPAADQDKK